MYPRANDIEAARISRRDLIGRIAIGVAHEIRNPLTVIKGYLQLQGKKSAYCTGESLDIILQELHKIEELVTDIISLAHNKVSKKTPENLNRILEKVYPDVRRAAARNGIVAELRLSDNLPLLNLNAEEIEQLIMNLAYNGIEAMRTSGRLTLGAVRESNGVILYVQDEGRGIPPEQIEQIFDPFYTTKANNTGLGLAVSLSIVERHQGEIEIISTIGAGSVFKILFPVVE
ncbi:two-component system sensor histidine kinase NtrB [Sporomusa sp.]|uniref:two-component system sensor histidine kinase NtrB n=1 Tax=Sporomusa sp. TaxID=2078658 RepID=UPI002C453E30|nr:ATP-binding protein [Sporomusa sp.]HWR42360.1 ATP-binding protein [Sporomusa sp.]